MILRADCTDATKLASFLRDGWVSVDPGKYSLAPWFAEQVATEICGTSAR